MSAETLVRPADTQAIEPLPSEDVQPGTTTVVTNRPPPPAPDSDVAARTRSVGPYISAQHRTRYLVILGSLIVAALVLCVLILTWGNDFEFLSDKWWRVSKMRISAVVVILTVTFAQAMATVTFQTVTNNRIITPSIMGFESLFILIPFNKRKINNP